MALTAAVVADAVEEYRAVQPLAAVEDEHLDLLPDTFEAGDYGWRDAEWVVQWYYRRYLGAYPDAERRAAETAYGENTFEEIRAAIDGAVDAADAEAKLRHLTALEGVGVPVGSAFLQFIQPDEYVVVGERTWSVLQDAGELEDSYPDPPSVPDYDRFLAASRAVSEQCGCSLWDLYRAAWVLGRD